MKINVRTLPVCRSSGNNNDQGLHDAIQMSLRIACSTTVHACTNTLFCCSCIMLHTLLMSIGIACSMTVHTCYTFFQCQSTARFGALRLSNCQTDTRFQQMSMHNLRTSMHASNTLWMSMRISTLSLPFSLPVHTINFFEKMSILITFSAETLEICSLFNFLWYWSWWRGTWDTVQQQLCGVLF
jgi:hypothetical protein